LRTENGRLLLVVCKAKCLKERADVSYISNIMGNIKTHKKFGILK